MQISQLKFAENFKYSMILHQLYPIILNLRKMQVNSGRKNKDGNAQSHHNQ